MIFVTNDDQIKEACSAVTVDLSIESLTSFLEDVEHSIIQMVGSESTAAILANTVALNAMRRTIVNLTLDKYASSGAVQISDAGIHVTKNDKKLPASDKKLLMFRRDAKERGWTAFEQLISIMESKKLDFSIWATSVERSNYLNTIFHSSTEFSSFAGLSISSDLFQVIKPQIAFVEDDVLGTHFGEELVTDIKGKILTGELSADGKKLLRYWLRIIGPLAIAEAIPYRSVQLSDSGIYQSSVTALGSNSDNIESQSIAQQRTLNNLMMKLTAIGESNVITAKKWLNANAASFSSYYSEKEIYPMENFNDPDSNVYLV